jgi:4-hydroxybenzoate polyprenyltransferase
VISLRASWTFAILLYVAAVVPTWLVVSFPEETLLAKLTASWHRHQCFFVFLAGMVCTFVYSAPWLGRTKAHTFLANLTIALPRGCLLKVAGWSMVASVLHFEPWFIGAIFFLFLLGASTSKDFADMEGDRVAGCRTLPLRYGVQRAAWIIAPFFVIPWLLMPLGAWWRTPWSGAQPVLTGNPWLLAAFGMVLAAWGTYTAALILRDPQSLASSENHPSWWHMYLMMMVAQVGFALAYLM